MPDLVHNIIVAFVLACTMFNVCWWLYSKTLSESFPLLMVVTIMLSTLLCFFIAFLMILRELCYTILSPNWGYLASHGVFIPYAEDIARILAGLLTIGIAFLLYKDEGKMAGSRYEDVDGEREKSPGAKNHGMPSSGGTRKDLGKIE